MFLDSSYLYMLIPIHLNKILTILSGKDPVPHLISCLPNNIANFRGKELSELIERRNFVESEKFKSTSRSFR